MLLQQLEPILRAYYVECKSLSEFRTTAWDLQSLLIKPVQRCLKYPLLLDQIFKATPRQHPDRANLKRAYTECLLVSEHINNSKKRQDIVDHVISRDMLHRRGSSSSSTASFSRSVTKKWTRSSQKVGQALGIKDRTNDEVFDALIGAVDSSRSSVSRFAIEMKDWSMKARLALEAQVVVVEGWREVYAPMAGERVERGGPYDRVSVFLDDVLKPVIKGAWQELVSWIGAFDYHVLDLTSFSTISGR